MFPSRRRLVLAGLAMLPAAASAQVRVSVHAGRGWMQLNTAGQTFLVRADSQSLAAWSDSAVALTARNAAARFAYFDSILGATQAVTFVRLSTGPTSAYEIIGEDGQYKGSTRVAFDSAQTILAKLHGVNAWKAPPAPPDFSMVPAPGAPFFNFQVERQAVPRPGQAAARYPRSAIRQRESGEVLAQVVVDTTGRTDMSKFKILKSTDSVFSNAVRDAMVNQRFFPAERDGRLVAELIQQPFAFNL
jgi:TonB family protein